MIPAFRIVLAVSFLLLCVACAGTRGAGPAHAETEPEAAHAKYPPLFRQLTVDPAAVEGLFGMIESGRGPEALAEFRALLMAYPEDAALHALHGRALLALHFQEPALEAARVAVALAEEDLAVGLNLGLVLEHDAVGRLHAPGWDRDGAVAAYRRLVDRHEDEAAAWASYLEILMVPDRDGVLETHPGAAVAVEACDEARSRPKIWAAVLRQCLAAYLTEARWRDVLVLSAEPAMEKEGMLWRVVALAMQDPDALEREIASRMDSPEEMNVFSVASQLLLEIRYYEGPATILDRMARIRPELRGLVDQLPKFERLEDLSFDPADPALLPVRVLQALVIPSSGVDAASLLAARSRQDGGERVLGNTRHFWELATGGDGEIPLLFAFDLAASTARYALEGSAEAGWEVRVQLHGTAEPLPMAFLVVEEEGGPRLLADPMSGAGPAAEQVLEALADDREDHARKWMERALSAHAWQTRPDVPLDEEGEGLSIREAFERVWGDGEDVPVARLRLAAALLSAENGGGAHTVEVLERALEGTEDAALRSGIRDALVLALVLGPEDEARAARAEALYAAHPEDDMVRGLYMMTAGEHDAARRIELLQAELGRSPERDPGIKFLIGGSFLELDRLDEAEDWTRRAMAISDTPARHLNNALWLSLFRDADPEALIAEARSLLAYPLVHEAEVHTAIAALATAGAAAEALRAFGDYLEAHRSDGLESHDWYLVGHLAELHGLEDAAVAAYRRVTRSDEMPASTFDLAQRRLAALGAALDTMADPDTAR
jgi:tetratricopeptide (TPR) repeat protein